MEIQHKKVNSPRIGRGIKINQKGIKINQTETHLKKFKVKGGTSKR